MQISGPPFRRTRTHFTFVYNRNTSAPPQPHIRTSALCHPHSSHGVETASVKRGSQNVKTVPILCFGHVQNGHLMSCARARNSPFSQSPLSGHTHSDPFFIPATGPNPFVKCSVKLCFEFSLAKILVFSF